jgi:transcriptional regulator with PAS, ATPase and Fis domain
MNAGGTIFLDEIADLTPAPRTLRVAPLRANI